MTHFENCSYANFWPILLLCSMQISSEKLIEEIMFRYLELCVDLKKSHVAKEGLFQYRNMCQVKSVVQKCRMLWTCHIFRAQMLQAWLRWCKVTSPWPRRRRRPPSRRPLTRSLSLPLYLCHWQGCYHCHFIFAILSLLFYPCHWQGRYHYLNEELSWF